MTDIKELSAEINRNPRCIADIDWKKETDSFDAGRMFDIIAAIESDMTYCIVKEYIAVSWYDMTSLYGWDNGKLFSIRQGMMIKGKEIYDTLPQAIPHERTGRVIEEVLDDFRKKSEKNRQTKIILRERRNRIENVPSITLSQTDESLQLSNLQADKKRLQERLIKEQEISRTLKEQCEALKSENARCRMRINELFEEKNILKAKLKNSDEEEASDSLFRKFVESIIEYSEKFPSNQNDKADVIKAMLQAKGFNGLIPEGILTAELRERIENLGRKEMPLPSMFSISGNKEVNIGGSK